MAIPVEKGDLALLVDCVVRNAVNLDAETVGILLRLKPEMDGVYVYANIVQQAVDEADNTSI